MSSRSSSSVGMVLAATRALIRVLVARVVVLEVLVVALVWRAYKDNRLKTLEKALKGPESPGRLLGPGEPWETPGRPL